MAEQNKQPIARMTEEEFKQELKGSLLVLSTSSPDKRNIFREYFSSHDLKKDDKDGYLKHGGIDAFFTDSGALGMPPRKTPEKTGTYEENLEEKYRQQIEYLKVNENNIRNQLEEEALNQAAKTYLNPFNPKKVKIVGMTEDSGWKIEFKDQETERKFIEKITAKLKPKIRKRDGWLLDKLHGEKEGFPGPNLKPFQEHLAGGFGEMTSMIYDVADEMGIKRLRYNNFSNLAFVSPENGKVFLKNFNSYGDLLTRDEYNQKIKQAPQGKDVNSDFLMIPDGQKEGVRDTVDELVKKGLYYKSSKDLPAEYARRDLTEYLQERIGNRRSTRDERRRSVHIAFADPDYMDNGKTVDASFPAVFDYKTSGIPHTEKLRHHPDKKAFDEAHAVVLIAEKSEPKEGMLHDERNYRMLTNFVTSTEVDPQAMGIPLILDNRTGNWDKTLRLFTDEFVQGRIKGQMPFYVANSTEEFKNILTIVKDVRQRAPIIKQQEQKETDIVAAPLETVPNDGIYSVFIAGGHANNSKRDLQEAKKLGYHCAQKNWRIVTGGGSIEGSMGSVHTGFIQYHLDRLQDTKQLPPEILEQIDKYKRHGRYDAEDIILEKPKLLEKLAGSGLIPRDKFYCYSLKPILEMESPSGEAPPATTYFDAGNRVRRLDALLSTGTKIFLPGSIGTDEELAEAVKQRVDIVEGRNNGKNFADGTPERDGQIILYNRNHHLDNLLEYYGFTGENGEKIKKAHNIIVVDDVIDQVKENADKIAASWAIRVKSNRQNGASSAISNLV